MNVQRLIEKYKKLEGVWDAEGAELARQIFLEDLKQLDKPQPVKVPQCVAEYIEFKKKNNFHVYGAMRVIEDHYDKKVPDWFYENNIEKFCLAWLDGYEVEKEKRYFVKIKGNIKENMLVYGEFLKRYFFIKSFSLDDVIYSHTRKELEDANFGWVFDCSGIEIEEVEE
ncbi:phage protein [Streptococcus pneumoniae]|nr:phage protein [Streptococcus pneumoniae]